MKMHSQHTWEENLIRDNFKITKVQSSPRHGFQKYGYNGGNLGTTAVRISQRVILVCYFRLSQKERVKGLWHSDLNVVAIFE